MQTWLHWVGLPSAKTQVQEDTPLVWVTWKCLGFSNVHRVTFVQAGLHTFLWIAIDRLSSQIKAVERLSVASDPGPHYSKVTRSSLSLAWSVLSVCVPSPATVGHLCSRGDTEPSWDQGLLRYVLCQRMLRKYFKLLTAGAKTDKHTSLWPEKSLQPTYYFKKLPVMHLQTLTQWKTWGDSFKFATTWSLLAFAVLIISAISFFFQAGFLFCSYFIRQRLIRRLKTTLLALMTIIIYTLVQAAPV